MDPSYVYGGAIGMHSELLESDRTVRESDFSIFLRAAVRTQKMAGKKTFSRLVDEPEIGHMYAP